MYYLLASIAVIAASLVAGNRLSLVLPRLHPLLNRKPFCCRPCLTFHLVWMGMGIVSFVGACGSIFLAGVAIAFVIFFILRRINNKKVTL